MEFDEVIMLIIGSCFVLGCIDRCFGNKFLLGKALEEGFSYMPIIALTAIGMICISPVLADVLEPVVVPVYNFLGVDSAMFSPAFFSMDAGGYSIAKELSGDEELINFGGLLVGSTVGIIISFNIPVGNGMLKKEDRKYFAIGTMSALICSPIGCFFGGLVCGMNVVKILINLIPIGIFALIVAIGTIFIADLTIKVFNIVARVIMITISIGLAIAAFKSLTGIEIINRMEDISMGFFTIGKIAISIAGSFCLLVIIKKVLNKPLQRVSKTCKIDEHTISALLISFITATPAFAMINNMNVKGKVIISAFSGTTAYLFGACLGYASTVNTKMILPIFVTKIISGILAVPLSVVFAKRIFKEC